MPKVNKSPNPEQLYAAYGEFMLNVSKAESVFRGLFSILTGFRDDVAILVFEGLTIGKIIEYLPDAIKSSFLDQNTKDRFNEICIQYKAINIMRNKLAHQMNYLDTVTATKLKCVPLKGFREESLAKTIEYDMTLLKAATSDIQLIFREIKTLFDETEIATLTYDLITRDIMKRLFEKTSSKNSSRQTSYTWQYKAPSETSAA